MTTFNRIECNAMIMFEMDMEHELEHLKKMLRDGQVCMNLHEDGSHLSPDSAPERVRGDLRQDDDG